MAPGDLVESYGEVTTTVLNGDRLDIGDEEQARGLAQRLLNGRHSGARRRTCRKVRGQEGFAREFRDVLEQSRRGAVDQAGALVGDASKGSEPIRLGKPGG